MSLIHYYNRAGDIVGCSETDGGTMEIDEMGGEPVWPIDTEGVLGWIQGPVTTYWVDHGVLTVKSSGDPPAMPAEIYTGMILAPAASGDTITVIGRGVLEGTEVVVPDLLAYPFTTAGTYTVRFETEGSVTVDHQLSVVDF